MACLKSSNWNKILWLLSFSIFYIEIITGIKVDKNNTYGHLKLSMNGVVATLKWNKGVFSLQVSYCSTDLS